MIPIKELLNKIKWDKRYYPEQYTAYYHDRIEDNLVPVNLESIRTEGNFMVVDKDDTKIPLHRIRKVMKGRMLVWRR